MAFVVPGFLAFIGMLLIGLRGWMWLRAPHRHLCPGPHLNWRQRLWPLWIVFQPRCGYDLSGHLLRSPFNSAHRSQLEVRGAITITCPECGRVIRRTRQLIRTPRAWRPAHLGAVFILAGVLVYRYPPLSATALVQYTPTDILLRGEGMLGVGTPLEVRDEIRRRAMDHQLRDDQVCQFVQLLVNDLRDDSLAGNARAALDQLAIFGVFCAEPLMAAVESSDQQQRELVTDALRDLPDGSADRNRIIRISMDDLRSDRSEWTRRNAQQYLAAHLEFAQPLLIEALASDDQQQRHCAVSVLRHAQTDDATLQTVLAMSIDDLRDDEYRNNRGSASWFLYEHRERAKDLLLAKLDSDDHQQRDAAIGILRRTNLEGEPLERVLRRSVHELRLDASGHRVFMTFRYVLQHASAADPLLLQGMQGDDPQQRLLCAAIAGCAVRLSLMEAATPILISHLADNDVRGDAIIAARALNGFGAPVLPLLDRGRLSPDQQQRQAVEYIIRRMTTADSIAQLQRELPLARLTLADVDALALEPEQFDMPRFPSKP